VQAAGNPAGRVCSVASERSPFGRWEDTQIKIQLSDEERRRSWNPAIAATASALRYSTHVDCGIKSAEDAACLMSVEASSV
jgi:hypothetical protein